MAQGPSRPKTDGARLTVRTKILSTQNKWAPGTLAYSNHDTPRAKPNCPGERVHRARRDTSSTLCLPPLPSSSPSSPPSSAILLYSHPVFLCRPLLFCPCPRLTISSRSHLLAHTSKSPHNRPQLGVTLFARPKLFSPLLSFPRHRSLLLVCFPLVE